MKVNHSVPEFEYNHIDEGVYVGTNACCQTEFDKRILAEGITHDISMEGEQIDMAYGVDSYLWLPTVDHTSPSLSAFTLGVSQIENIVAMGEKVYIHCKMGHGRGPSLAIAYFAKKRNISVNDAFEFVKSKRPVIHLDEIQFEGIKAYLNTLK